MKNPRLRRKIVWAAPIAAACYFGCSDNGNDIFLPDLGPDTLSRAEARVRGYSDTTIHGIVKFSEDGDSVLIEAEINGLEPGKPYGIHVHQFGDCSAPEASGEHFDPSEPHGNPFDSLGTHHRGDLPNLVAGDDSIGRFEFRTQAMVLDSGTNSALGRSVVVHADPDDFETQPSGGSGDRIACGIIALTNENGDRGRDTTGTETDTTGTGIDTTYLDPLPFRP